MDKFIIMNVHDATPKELQKNNPKFFLAFFLSVWKTSMLKKNGLKLKN
jgi:hypothetical protein